MSEILQFPAPAPAATYSVDVSPFVVMPMWEVRRNAFSHARDSSSVRIIAFGLRAAASGLLHEELSPPPDGCRWMGVSATHARDRTIELLELAAELEERHEQASSGPAR